MVAAAADNAAREGLSVEVMIGDAGDPDLPTGSFDIVTASLVLFFLPKPDAALSAWGELLVDGGRIGVSTFGAYDAAWEPVDAIFEPYLPPDLRDARTTGKQGSFGSDEGVERLLVDAGFADVRTASGPVSVRFDAWMLSSAATSVIVAAAYPRGYEGFRRRQPTARIRA